MKRTEQQLREDALAIWQAGVSAVASERLVRDNVQLLDDAFQVGDSVIPLEGIERIAIVGAGKAGAGMTEGLLHSLAGLPEAIRVEGWVNVPEDCVRPLDQLRHGARVRLFGARPAGHNEPTEAGVEGTRRILDLVGHLGPGDLCFCVLSGGGSALLPAPAPGITLSDKQAITRFLSGAGADIWQLNTVRKQLSRVKGGGLARACSAGRMVTLIISDVLGDPLDIIASGPTVPNQSTPDEALQILERFDAPRNPFAAIYDYFTNATSRPAEGNGQSEGPATEVTNLVIGNNAWAVDAAGQEAERRGYSHAMHTALESEGAAEEVGRHLADMALKMQTHGSQAVHQPDCLITGGEPIVQLAPPERRGKGGRNQQLVLAALERLRRQAGASDRTASPLEGIVLLSGGTDGEDGPTDAAGAILTADVERRAAELQLAPSEYLDRNDAYHFFEQSDGLLKTGATHTNVCDLRVVVVDRVATETEGSPGD